MKQNSKIVFLPWDRSALKKASFAFYVYQVVRTWNLTFMLSIYFLFLAAVVDVVHDGLLPISYGVIFMGALFCVILLVFAAAFWRVLRITLQNFDQQISVTIDLVEGVTIEKESTRPLLIPFSELKAAKFFSRFLILGIGPDYINLSTSAVAQNELDLLKAKLLHLPEPFEDSRHRKAFRILSVFCWVYFVIFTAQGAIRFFLS